MSAHDPPSSSASPVRMIAAVERSGGIGLRGDLPWPFLEPDATFYRESVRGGALICGRKTWEATPEPCDARYVVLTRDTDYQPETPEGYDVEVRVAHSLDAALEAAQSGACPVWIIGGEALYTMGLDVAREVWLTRIDEAFEVDARFPVDALEAREDWQRAEVTAQQRDPATGLAYAFETWRRDGG